MPSRVLVAGASDGGIGGAIARRLTRDAAAAGAGLMIALSATGADPALADLAADLRRLGAGGVQVIPGDLTSPGFPAALAADAAAFCGGLDLAVLAAGRAQSAPLAALGAGDWQDMLSLHVIAAGLLAAAAFPHLAASGGSLVAIGSVSGRVPHAGRGAYPAAKAALAALCAQLAAEWAQAGVRVNMVSPGLVATRRRPKAWAPQVVPLGRAATPEDIAAAVAFLAGPDAAYITGQDLAVDGGLVSSALGVILHE